MDPLDVSDQRVKGEEESCDRRGLGRSHPLFEKLRTTTTVFLQDVGPSDKTTGSEVDGAQRVEVYSRRTRDDITNEKSHSDTRRVNPDFFGKKGRDSGLS